MQTIVLNCLRDGLFGSEDLTVGVCDLDLASPTATYLLDDQKPLQDRKNTWTNRLTQRALTRFKSAQKENNIIIAE